MLKTETANINDKDYIRTWSDLNMMLERDGAMYEEALDPAELGRTYTETDQPIVDESEATESGQRDYDQERIADMENALNILLGGDTE